MPSKNWRLRSGDPPPSSSWIAFAMKYAILVTAIQILVSNDVLAVIVEDGDLNIINDPTNPSNGLRYVDSSLSVGFFNVNDALANVRLTYPNARFATPSEFDDLFLAAGISGSPSISFDTGGTVAIASGTNYDYDPNGLLGILGQTATSGGLPILRLWTSPDGSSDSSTTRDLIQFQDSAVLAANATQTPLSSGSTAASLIVTAVPETSSFLCVAVAGLVAMRPNSVRTRLRR